MLSAHAPFLVLFAVFCVEVGNGISPADGNFSLQQESSRTWDWKTANAQSQNRSVPFERNQNSFDVSISCCDSVTQVVSYPIAVLVTFSIPVSLSTSAVFSFVNCYPLNTTMLTSTSYSVVLVPLRHGVFSVTLPANTLTVGSLRNEAASLVRIYVGGVLESSLHSIGWEWAALQIVYDYSAVVHCMYSESETPPASCRAIQASASYANVTVSPGVPSLLLLQGVALNHTYAAFCCAEEPLGVQMLSSIADTRVVIEVGWLDCPLFRGIPCSGHGQCMETGWCNCSTGYYGAFCNKACDGLIEEGEVKECNGRGTCRREGYQCECDDPLFSGSGCSLSLFEADTPSEGHGFVFFQVQSESEDETSLRVGLVLTLGQIANVSTLVIGLREFHESSDFLYLFYIHCEESRLGSVLDSLTASDVRQRIVASLTQQAVSFDRLVVGTAFSVTARSDPYWCYDGTRDQDETDVDCGGDTCSRRCALGAHCLWDYDCQRGTCVDGECAVSTGLNGWSIVPVLALAVVVVLAIGVVVWGQKQLKEARNRELPIVSAPLPSKGNSSLHASVSVSATNVTENRDVFTDDQTVVSTSETDLEKAQKEKARAERAFARKHKTVASDTSLNLEPNHHTSLSDERRFSRSLGEMGIAQRPPVALFHSHYHLVNDSK